VQQGGNQKRHKKGQQHWKNVSQPEEKSQPDYAVVGNVYEQTGFFSVHVSLRQKREDTFETMPDYYMHQSDKLLTI